MQWSAEQTIEAEKAHGGEEDVQQEVAHGEQGPLFSKLKTGCGVIKVYDNGFYTYTEHGCSTGYGVDRCDVLRWSLMTTWQLRPRFKPFLVRLYTEKSLIASGFSGQRARIPRLYRYFCENCDFEAFLARLQEIGKKMARRKSVVYTRFVRCRVSCRQENGKKSRICRWIRSHGKEPKNAEKTRGFGASRD